MGMFDEFHFEEGELLCAGHHSIDTVQTKDLACTMEHFYAHGGRVFRAKDAASDDSRQEVKDDELIVTTISRHALEPLRQGRIHVYTSCRRCDPVVVEEAVHTWGAGTSEHQPWCSWDLIIDKAGRIAVIQPVRVESRDDVRKKLLEATKIVLPDDDRVAKRVIEQHREGLKR